MRNIGHLHYVLDLWVDVWRRKVANGDVIMVRYADDLVLSFRLRANATRFLEELKGRRAKFGLELNPDKTPLIEFGRLCCQRPAATGRGKTVNVQLLGLNPLLWASPKDRNLHRRASYGENTNGSEAQS